MAAPTPVLSPVDVARRLVRAPARMRVGGRVAHVDDCELRLADAFCSLKVVTESAADVACGDLLVVQGTYARQALRSAQVIERHAAPETAGSGEFARLAWRGVGPRLRQRSAAFRSIRDYFNRQGFVEVDTPLRVRTPGLDANVDALRAEGGYLVTSPELHMKRLLVGGMPRVYQLCHCSRAEECGPQHEPEFMMLEWYRAFCGVERVMRDTERVVLAVVQAITNCDRLRLPGGRSVSVSPPFERLTVRQAFRRYAGESDAVALARRSPQRFFELLVDRVEPALARRRRPVFLCDYPVTEAALARHAPHDPDVAERFELYVGGVELCNGFGELTDPDEQRRRFVREQAARRRQRRPVYPVDEVFLSALREGLPPSGGNALGVDRLVALACGSQSVAEVQAFPSDRL